MHSLATKIDDLRRRLVWRERAVAACWTLGVILAAACVLGLADFLIRFADRGLRMMLSTALVAAAGWAVVHWWLLPRRRRGLDSLAVARRVEARFPQLRDRLASALEFLTQSEDDPTAGSAALRRAVVADAELATADLPIDAVIDRQPLRRAAAWAGVAAAVVAIFTLVSASAVQTAALRLLAPWGSTDWPRANHLEFRDPPTRLAAGQTFEVELVDRGGQLPEDVQIQYRLQHDGRREVQSEWMNRVGDMMVARRENVRQSFAIRAEGGDDHTMRWTNVEVVEPPQLKSMKITVHPPSYTGLPAAPAEQHLDVLAGTGIEVSGTASEPLGAARILSGDTRIEATIGADAAGHERRGFHVAPQQWIAAKSGDYRLELENTDGVAGIAGQWPIRVEPDTPPTVTWLRPRDDLYLLPTAVVPLAVQVKDDLAVARVDSRYERSDLPKAEPKVEGEAPAEPSVLPPIAMYRGPARITPELAAALGDHGDTRTVEHNWPLTPLNLSPGTQLTLRVRASDYRPATGETVTPRRINIITRDALDARLADRQAQITRRLDDALKLQRTTRGDTRGLEIQLRDAGRLTAGDQETLQAAELNQRRVSQSLTDRSEGLPALVDAFAAELEINAIDSPDVWEPLENLQKSLSQLAAGPLPAADEQLTTARKTAEAAANQAAELSRALANAGSRQEEIASRLDQLLGELAGWADFGRFIRDLAQLRADQLAHRQTTRDQVSLETLPLELRELSRQQRATLNKSAAAEDELTHRYERIERSMAELAAQHPNSAESERLADAVDLAHLLAIADNMRETSRDLSENRVGQALARETAIAEAIQEVLDVLRDRPESRPEQLMGKLRAAEKKMAELRRQLAALRADAQQAEQGPAANEAEQRDLRNREQQLQSQIQRLARQLERLQAAEAGRSSSQAAEKLTQDSANAQQSPKSQPIEQAEQDLNRAAQQLAARRRQAEEDWSRAFLNRFQVVLAAMVDKQKEVIRSTIELDGQRAAKDLTEAQQQAAKQIAEQERDLATESHVHSEFLAGLHVFGLALGEAEKQLTTAAEQLDDRQTGQPAQQAERRALERFKQIVEALKQTAAEANPQQPPPAGVNNQGAGNQSKRPTFDLFEVKLLRMLQVDLNARTQAFEQEFARQPATTDAQRAARRQTAGDLAAEQGHLAELVQELLSRDNKQDEK